MAGAYEGNHSGPSGGKAATSSPQTSWSTLSTVTTQSSARFLKTAHARRIASWSLVGDSGITATSSPGAVVEVNHAAFETALVKQLELHADVVGDGAFAAPHYDGRDEQVPLVD
jgi:hypothetical protein